MTEQLRPGPGRARPLVLATLLLALLPATAAQHLMSQAVAEVFADPQAAGARAPATAGALVTVTVDTNRQPAEPAPLAYHTPPPVYPATASQQPAPGQSLARMLDGMHELIIPVERLQAIPPPDPDMDCVALYRQTGQLLRLGERYRPVFQDDPRNKAIGVIGLAYTPVLYLWGVTSYAAWFEDNHRAEARERVSEVRRLMAERRCFARE